MNELTALIFNEITLESEYLEDRVGDKASEICLDVLCSICEAKQSCDENCVSCITYQQMWNEIKKVAQIERYRNGRE